MGKQAVDLWVSAYILIGKTHEAATQVPHRGHGKGLAQFSGAATGVEWGHHVDGVVAILLEGTADLFQG